MFFNSKRRSEKREAKRKERIIQEVTKKDPTFQVRMNRYKEIMNDSINLMSNTKNLSTLIERRTDAKSSALQLEEMFLRLENDCCEGIQEEIDALFVERLPVVLALEIESASQLKTEAGKRKRWNGLIQALGHCDRLDGDTVDIAIAEAEEQLFLLLEKGIDFSKEPEAADFSLSEDYIIQIIKEEAMKKGEEIGLSKSDIESLLSDTFDNK